VSRDRAVRTLALALTWLTVAVCATYVVLVLAAVRPAEGQALRLAAVFLLLAAVAWARAAQAGWQPPDVLLATGQSLAAAGWTYWAVALTPLTDPPYPSAADALWVARFPILYLALAWHVGRFGAARRALSLDVLIGALGVTAAVAGMIVPALASTPHDTLVVGVNAVYLGAAVAYLLTLVSVVTARGLRVPVGLWRQVAGAVLLVATNSVFLVEVADTGVIPFGTVLSFGWLASYALLTSGVGTPIPTERRATSRGALVVVPLTGSVLALAVLLTAYEDPAARWIASAAIALAMGRMVLAFVEAEELAGSHRLAHTDELTGLVNRRGFGEALQRTLASGDSAVLVLADLNRFKEVNDALGHQTGDELLERIGQRLTAETRSDPPCSDVVARVGGDEFALLLRRTSASDAEEAARRLVDGLAAVYEVGGVTVRASASAGVVHLPGQGRDPVELMRRADVAMYAAKALGAPVVVYRADLDTRNAASLERVEQVRASLADGGLVLHYQPKVDLRTDAVTGVEALARLRDPAGELMLPGHFLPLLDHAAQLVSLTTQVLDAAVAQAAAWRAVGVPLSVAVNVPAAALVEPRFADRVEATLQRHGVAGRLLSLEVTEESLLHDRAAGRAALDEVRTLGVRVSIDDYGTGWSSLTYLRELPLDELKLDRSFIRGMATDPRATRIVRSTVALAHGLDLTVVAEGVETPEDRDAATEAGCDLAQGYWFARPLPADRVLGLLRNGPILRAPAAREGTISSVAD